VHLKSNKKKLETCKKTIKLDILIVGSLLQKEQSKFKKKIKDLGFFSKFSNFLTWLQAHLGLKTKSSCMLAKIK
jgi:hypothetical protein